MNGGKDMNVLVVGGAGYIGGSVVDFFQERGIPHAVYDHLLYEHQYLKPVDFIFGDVRDTQKLARVLPRFTHVIWLAAIVGDAACRLSPALTEKVNRDSVRWLTENYSGRIVFTSTCSVYGQQNALLDEGSPTKPLSLYARTKLEAESFLLHHPNALIFRLGTAYGLSDTYSRLRMDLALNYMTANAVTKKKLTVFGGTQWRPLMHVKDIAEAIAGSAHADSTGIYNLATRNISIRELAERIRDLTGCDIEYQEQKSEDARNYRVSTEKAQRADILSHIRNRSLEDGIQEIASLIASSRLKYIETDVYFNERHLANLLKNGYL